MRWTLAYIGGYLIIGLMVFYYLKGVVNVIRHKKPFVLLLSLVLIFCGVYGLLNTDSFSPNLFFWVFACSFLLLFNSVLIGLRFSNNKPQKYNNPEPKLKKSVIQLFVSLIAFIVGTSPEKQGFFSIAMLIIFMYTFLLGSYGLISRLNRER